MPRSRRCARGTTASPGSPRRTCTSRCASSATSSRRASRPRAARWPRRLPRARDPFAVATGVAGAFPGPARPRILWIGASEGAASLVALAAQVERALAREGFPPADKPFTPHLTVGRVRAAGPGAPRSPASPAAARFLALSLPPQRFDVGVVTLVASTLGAGGSRYTPLFAAPLVAPAPPSPPSPPAR